MGKRFHCFAVYSYRNRQSIPVGCCYVPRILWSTIHAQQRYYASKPAQLVQTPAHVKVNSSRVCIYTRFSSSHPVFLVLGSSALGTRPGRRVSAAAWWGLSTSRLPEAALRPLARVRCSGFRNCTRREEKDSWGGAFLGIERCFIYHSQPSIHNGNEVGSKWWRGGWRGFCAVWSMRARGGGTTKPAEYGFKISQLRGAAQLQASACPLFLTFVPRGATGRTNPRPSSRSRLPPRWSEPALPDNCWPRPLCGEVWPRSRNASEIRDGGVRFGSIGREADYIR